jgi:hypothetical protein
VGNQEGLICAYVLDGKGGGPEVDWEQALNPPEGSGDDMTFIPSLVTILSLPTTFITGLPGIDADGIPGEEHPPAFHIVCTRLTTLAGGVCRAFRRVNLFRQTVAAIAKLS